VSRFRAGWFIPMQVVGLTHTVPDVTLEDFQGIFEEAKQCVRESCQPFHLIIDNRLIQSDQVASLENILQAMPDFNGSMLRHIVMILPSHLKGKAAELEPQQVGPVRLRYVDTLPDAFAALRAADSDIQWKTQQPGFFTED
jgi:hypothetical protein